jgi:hypothetical protein
MMFTLSFIKICLLVQKFLQGAETLKNKDKIPYAYSSLRWGKRVGKCYYFVCVLEWEQIYYVNRPNWDSLCIKRMVNNFKDLLGYNTVQSHWKSTDIPEKHVASSSWLKGKPCTKPAWSSSKQSLLWESWILQNFKDDWKSV